MFQYMHRDIEDNAFLDWLSLIRNGNIRALFVHGARQVGKRQLYNISPKSILKTSIILI